VLIVESTPLTSALTQLLASIAHATTLGCRAPLCTNPATPSSVLSLRTTRVPNPVEELTHTGSALGRGPSSTVTNALVAQRLKRRDQMLRFLFLFPYIQCPLWGLNSSSAHMMTGNTPYHGKAPSGLFHSFVCLSHGTSLLDLPRSPIIVHVPLLSDLSPWFSPYGLFIARRIYDIFIVVVTPL
jgi:hypothetical protein